MRIIRATAALRGSMGILDGEERAKVARTYELGERRLYVEESHGYDEEHEQEEEQWSLTTWMLRAKFLSAFSGYFMLILYFGPTSVLFFTTSD